MNTYNLIIFPIIFFFLNTSPHFSVSDSVTVDKDGFHKIYFIKQNWHTAIVFNTQELDSQIFREYDFNLSEIVIELEITDQQFKKICNYINKTFYKKDYGESIILNRKAEGKIIFYKAVGSYHLFNTCNTWLANGVRQAGIEIEENILLTEQLFNELAKIGTVIKSYQPED